MNKEQFHYRCQRCLETFHLKKEIQIHFGKDDKLNCTPHENYQFTDEECKIKSLIKIPSNSEENRTCKLCDKIFSSVYNYKRHYREQHTRKKVIEEKPIQIFDGKTNISNNPYVITTCKREIDPVTGHINNTIENTTNTTTLRLIFEVRVDGEYHDTYIYERKYINGILVGEEEDICTKIVFEMIIQILQEKGIDIYNVQNFVDKVTSSIDNKSGTNHYNITLPSFV